MVIILAALAGGGFFIWKYWWSLPYFDRSSGKYICRDGSSALSERLDKLREIQCLDCDTKTAYICGEKFWIRIGGSVSIPEKWRGPYDIKQLQEFKEAPISSFGVKDETADISTSSAQSWQTYRNEEYGFEFKYPNDWYDYDHKRILVSQDSKMGIEIVAAYEFSKGYTLKEWANYLAPVYIQYLNTDYITHTIEETYLVDKEAVVSLTIWWSQPPDFKGESWPMGSLHKDIFFPCKGFICAISTNFPEADRNQYEPLLNQMLSTFTFLR